jgi:hypothetical protein
MTNNLSFSEKKDKPDTPQQAAGRVHFVARIKPKLTA